MHIVWCLLIVWNGKFAVGLLELDVGTGMWSGEAI